MNEDEAKQLVEKRAQQKANEGVNAYQKFQLGEEIINDVQMLNAHVQPLSPYSNRDITTAYYTPDTVEIQTEAIPLIMELDGLRLFTCRDMLIDAMAAHADTTKGKGNSAILLTKMAAYRFTMGETEDSGLGDKAAKAAEWLSKKMVKA